jgi:hypothetical protein
MARSRNPNAPTTDSQNGHPGGDELSRLMSELVSLREKVAEAELATRHSGSFSAAANSARNEAAN